MSAAAETPAPGLPFRAPPPPRGALWVVALALAVAVHAGVVAVLLRAPPESGAFAAPEAVVVIDLPPAPAAVETPADRVAEEIDLSAGEENATAAAPDDSREVSRAAAPLAAALPEAEEEAPPPPAETPPPPEAASALPSPQPVERAEEPPPEQPAVPAAPTDVAVATAPPAATEPPPEPVAEPAPPAPVEPPPEPVAPPDALAGSVPLPVPRPAERPSETAAAASARPAPPALTREAKADAKKPAGAPKREKTAEKRSDPNREQAGAPKAAETVAGKPKAGAAPQAGGGAREADALKRYSAAVSAAIQRQLRSTDPGLAVVRLEWRRDGTVVGASIAKSSGVPRLDRAVLIAVKRASPLPPAPPELTQPSFRSNQPIRSQ